MHCRLVHSNSVKYFVPRCRLWLKRLKNIVTTYERTIPKNKFRSFKERSDFIFSKNSRLNFYFGFIPSGI